jgi:predicted alpha/beta hydrolase
VASERDAPATTGDDTVVDHTLTAPDGRRLSARIYWGEACDVVVVAPATGVLQRFYDGFARAVRSRGATAITFDYRGIGGSRTHHPRRDPARMREWGTQDIEAALRHAADLAGERGGRVLWVGQSAGICFLPLASSRHVPDRIVSVSGLSGHWRLMQPSERRRLWTLWHVLAPVMCRFPGYAPRWAWGGEDLPAGVLEDWMRWCRHPDYLFGDETVDATGFDGVTAPILAIRAIDDPWATPAAHAALHDRFTAADVEVVEVGPSDVGAERIGHIDLLRRSVGAPYWPKLLDWLFDG